MRPDSERTAREVLFSQLFSDVDQLLSRVEALQAKVAEVEGRLATSTAVLDAAGERYRSIISAFTEQAKQTLTGFIERKAGEAAAQLTADHRQELRDALRDIAEHAHQAPRSPWPRLAEILGAALLSSVLTAGLVYWLLR